MSRGFPTVGKLGQASKPLADLVIYHEWNWVGLETNDRRYGNRETVCEYRCIFHGGILNFANPSYSPIQIATPLKE